MCYLHLNIQDAPFSHTKLTANRVEFKAFCKLNANEMKTFMHLNLLAVKYTFAKWKEMLQLHEQEVYKRQVAYGKVRNTILPNFGAAVDSSIELINDLLGE
jgi:hypothetical protein